MNLIPFHSFEQPERLVYVNPERVAYVDTHIVDGTDWGARIILGHRAAVLVLESPETVVELLRKA